VDALRYDYVSEKDTPFIHRLAEEGLKLQLRPILGYSDVIRATIFTGLYPDRHGYWMSYFYSPETSPFKFLRFLGFVDYIPSDLIRRGFKYLLSSTIVKAVGKLKGYSNLHLHNMPFRIICRFDMALRRPMKDPGAFSGCPTIFDVLREHGIKFTYLDSSKLKRKLLNEIRRLDEDVRFVFVYLHYLDESAHWFGLESLKFNRSLRAVDNLVYEIVSMLKRKFSEDLTTVVFSDHGMTEEKSRVRLDWLTNRKDFGRDFVLCLDATMIRIWYKQVDRRAELRRLILEAGSCRLLTEIEKKELGIEFKDRRYGDDIFLFDEGHIIFPNFYSYIRPKAMHAYDPAHPSQHGIFIFNDRKQSVTASRRIIDLVDVAPSLLALLDLPIPTTCQGRLLWA